MWRKVMIVLGGLVTVTVSVAAALGLSESQSSDSFTNSSENIPEEDVLSVVGGVVSSSKLEEELNIPDLEVTETIVGPAATSKGKTESQLIGKFHLPWITRSQWLAEPLTGSMDVLKHPVPYVIIAHTATESCYRRAECILRTRLIQEFHVESRNWSDIGYNFLIGGDGSVYDGRGWDTVGAHTKGYNKYSIGIAFIGSFNTETPTGRQLEACKKLLKIGVDLGKVAKNYELLAPSELHNTISPGVHLLDVIKTWPHFVKKPTHSLLSNESNKRSRKKRDMSSR